MTPTKTRNPPSPRSRRKRALKTLKTMQPKAAQAMMERLEAIAADPFASHANVKPLTGAKDVFRLRQGDWRAIYQIDRKSDTMQVTAIGPRGSVYE
jgi:mRNA interferase RelE/StbE